MIEPGPHTAAVSWTRRSYLLLAVGGALLVAALAVRSAVPLVLAVPLLVAPFVAAWSVPGGLGRIDLSWQETGAGKEVVVEGTLAGALGRGARDLEVTTQVPEAFVALRPTDYDYAGGTVRFRTAYAIPEPTVVTLPPAEVAWVDPMGLSRRETEGERPKLALDRFPIGLKGMGAVRLDRTIQLPGESVSRRVGSSGEFFTVRRAQTGEPLRRINWVASARIGKLLANDYHLDRAGDLIVLVDRRPSGLGEVHDERLLSLSKAAAFGVADSLLRGKIRIGFASFGEFVEALPLSTGRVQRLRIFEAINGLTLAPVAGPPPRCVFGLRRYYRPGVTTLVISSWAGESTGELVPYLRLSGYPVVMLSPSTVPLGAGVYPLTAGEEAVARAIERLERREKLAALWPYGTVIDWEDFWSLSGLVHSLRQPVHRRRS